MLLHFIKGSYQLSDFCSYVAQRNTQLVKRVKNIFSSVTTKFFVKIVAFRSALKLSILQLESILNYHCRGNCRKKFLKNATVKLSRDLNPRSLLSWTTLKTTQ